MQILTVITQAGDQARRQFTRGEQSMLIDIFNGTALTPGILGQHLLAQVEDSFDLYPGQYEEKWGTDRKEMLDKIVSLDPVSAAALELWAVGFWALQDGGPDALNNMLSGKLNLDTHMLSLIARLDGVSEALEKTKAAFKSSAIRDARAEVESVIAQLRDLL